MVDANHEHAYIIDFGILIQFSKTKLEVICEVCPERLMMLE